MARNLVLQVGLAQVEQRLPRHRRVLHAVFLGHQRQDGIHQRRFARGRTRLDDHGQGLVQQTAGRGQVADELVGGLTDDPAALEVLQDAIEQVRVSQKRHRGLPLFVAQLGAIGLVVACRLELLVLQLLELEQDAAEVPLDDLLVDGQLVRSHRHVLSPLACGVELQAIDVEARALTGTQHVDAHDLEGGVLAETANAPGSIAELEHDLVVPVGSRDRRVCWDGACGFGRW